MGTSLKQHLVEAAVVAVVLTGLSYIVGVPRRVDHRNLMSAEKL